jgi:hypothetical protein
MPDDTEITRRAMLPLMPAELELRIRAGESVWNTDEMRQEFDVLGFAAPFMAVRRKADGVKGSLMFTHSPRWYFGWQEDR